VPGDTTAPYRTGPRNGPSRLKQQPETQKAGPGQVGTKRPSLTRSGINELILGPGLNGYQLTRAECFAGTVFTRPKIRRRGGPERATAIGLPANIDVTEARNDFTVNPSALQ
jgi:hypothetical protein